MIAKRTTFVASVLVIMVVGHGSSALAQSGENLRVDVDDDPRHISPPTVVEPLFGCAEAVSIEGAIAHSTVTVFIDGIPVASAESSGMGDTLPIPSALEVGMEVSATQVLDGLESDHSPSARVRDWRDTFPNGLPVPKVDPIVIYECGYAMAASGQLHGSDVSAFRNEHFESRTIGSSNGNSFSIPSAPFVIGDQFFVQYEMCGTASELSRIEVALERPQQIPVPTLEPTPLVDGQEQVSITGAINGALVHVLVNGDDIGSVALARGRGAFGIGSRLGRPLTAGDTITLRQQLCRGLSEESPAVGVSGCESLPAPAIAPPGVGATRVTVTESVPGARLLVVDDTGAEIGDGTAPTVNLYRRLVADDVITVVQVVGDCVSAEGYVIPVQCRPYEEIPDIAAMTPYPVASLDYDLGTVLLEFTWFRSNPDGSTTPIEVRHESRLAGTFWFPTLDGTSPLPAGPPLPIFIVVHGMHGKVRLASGEDRCEGQGSETPSYRGFDYLLESLAAHGFVAVSINANDINCEFNEPMADVMGRTELLFQHIELWRRVSDGSADFAGGMFEGRVDPQRTVVAGHSRGGEAAVRVSELTPVAGVLAVAPTLTPPRQAATQVPEVWQPLLAIVPGNDMDVVSQSGFRYYDAAEPEWFRALAYIHNANHNYFNSEWAQHDRCAAHGARMNAASQRSIMRTLGVSFARSVTGMDDQFLSFADGSSRLAGDDWDEVYWSLHNHGDAVVDDFENLDVTENRMGGEVVHDEFRGFGELDVSPDTSGIRRTFRHATAALQMLWLGPSRFISTVPNTPLITAGHNELSVRIGLVGANDFSHLDPFSVSIGIIDAEGLEHEIEIGASREISQPYTRDESVPECEAGFSPWARQQSAMSTYRVPLACLSEGLDAADVRQIVFDTMPSSRGFIITDDLAFSRMYGND